MAWLLWAVVVVASGSGLGLVLGLGLAQRMLGLLRDDSPSIWVLVHWCGLAAVARLPVAVVGSSCIISWGGAKLECHVGPSALSVVLVHLACLVICFLGIHWAAVVWELLVAGCFWMVGWQFCYGDA